MPNLMFLAPTVPEIWRGSQNFKSMSRDSFPTCKWGVASDPIFGFLFDPDLPIHYITFMGLRWRLRVFHRWASPLLRPFWREIFQVPSKIGEKMRFSGRNWGRNVTFCFRDPQKAHPCAKRHLTYRYWSWKSVHGSWL